MMSNQVNRITSHITQDKQAQDHRTLTISVIMDDIQRRGQLKAPTYIATSEQRCKTENIT